MEVKTLYKYTNEQNHTITTLDKPSCAYTTMSRIVAGEGKAITKDSISLYSVIDTTNEDVTNWIEVDAPPEDEEPEQVDENEERGN